MKLPESRICIAAADKSVGGEGSLLHRARHLSSRRSWPSAVIYCGKVVPAAELTDDESAPNFGKISELGLVSPKKVFLGDGGGGFSPAGAIRSAENSDYTEASRFVATSMESRSMSRLQCLSAERRTRRSGRICCTLE